jgi:hypothetical protein
MREPTEESFAKDVARHEMTVILDKAEHRHLRFSKPDSSDMHFYITTWPGYLSFSGDMGCYVFARLRDMFEFFRGDRINLGYWAEKIQAADRSGVKEYEPDKLAAYVEEYTKDWPEEVREEARAAVLHDDEHDARKALYAFESDGHEFHDSWEVDFTEYTGRFVWCCRAIVWAIQQYDDARDPTPAETSEGAAAACCPSPEAGYGHRARRPPPRGFRVRGAEVKTAPLGPGGALRVLRTLRDHTQRSLAAAAGLDDTYVSELETGRRAPGPNARRKLQAALALPPGLYERLSKMTPETVIGLLRR